MPEVPVTSTPAAATPASTNVAPAQVQSVTNEPKTVTMSEADYAKLNGAVQRANRIVDELSAKLEKVTQAPPSSESPKLPQGVEAELKALRTELEDQRRVAAQEKLDAEIMRSATALGVDPNRIKYLKMELRESHGQSLTHEGTPDPIDSSKRISVETIIKGILTSPAGAMFKAAPSTATLPTASANGGGAQQKQTLKLSEWVACRNKGGDAYTQLHARVKAGEVVLVDD